MRGRKPTAQYAKSDGTLRVPSYLTPVAKTEWKRAYRLLQDISTISQLDAAVLAGYAQSYARWREAEAAIEQHGMLIEEQSVSRAGVCRTVLKKNPALTVSKEAQALMLRYVAALGLSPADRTRIANAASAPEDAIEDLLTPPPIESEPDE